MTNHDERRGAAAKARSRKPLVKRLKAGEAENNPGSGADSNGRLS